MKKHISQCIASILVVSIFFLACAKDEELQNIEELYEKAQKSGEEMKVQSALDYTLAIVLYQQKVVVKKPKQINTELLNTAIEFVQELQVADENALQDRLLNINTATLYMMLSSYYNAKGDLVQAVSNVDAGFQVFDSLIEIYPDDPIVRGYRAINYSALPDLFGKGEVVDSDFMFVYDYVYNTDIDALDEYTVGVLPHVFNAAITYYSNHDVMDKVTMFTEILRAFN